MRRDYTAAFFIIVRNSIPLVILLILGIDIHALLIAYWIEIGIVGAATVAKIRRAEGTDNPESLPGSEFKFRPIGRGESRTIRSMAGESKRKILRDFSGYYFFLWIFLGAVALSLPGEIAGLETASPQIVLGAVVTLSMAHIVSCFISFGK